MREISNRFLLFSLLLLTSSLLFAQTTDLAARVQQIDSLVAVGAFEEAAAEIQSAQEAVADTDVGSQDSTRLYFLSKLSFISYQLGDCDAAIEYGGQEVSLRDAVYGKADPLYLSSLRNYGIYHLNCGNFERADSTLGALLDIHREYVGRADETYVRTMDDLAFTKGKLGQIDEASSLYQDIFEMLGDKTSDFYLSVLDSYTSMLINAGRYAEAAPHYGALREWLEGTEDYAQFLRDFHNIFIFTRDFVKVYETARDLIDLSPGEPLAGVKLNGARAALLMGKYDSALLYYEKAYATFEDSAYARVQIHLERAGLYNARKSIFREIHELRRAKDLHEQHSLTDSSSYAQSVLSLGTTLTERGEFEQADEVFRQYISQLEGQSEVDYLKLAQAYQSLGNQKYLLQDYQEADAYLIQAEKTFTDNDLYRTIEYASCLNSLGALKEAIADYDLAKEMYRKAFAISVREEGSLRLKVASASNLANVLNAFDPANDSISLLYSQAIEWQHGLTGEYHPDYGNLLNKRGFFHHRIGEVDKAEQDYRRASQILAYTVGTSHPEYLVSMSNLGLLYSEQNNIDVAFSTMITTKQTYERNYSKDNPGYLLIANNLANLYTKMEDYASAEELFLELADINLRKIRESFSYLSEKEKEVFVAEKKKFLDSFKRYIVARYIEAEDQLNAEILTKWFELEQNTKGILLNSTKRVRDQIFQSGDADLIELFSNWTLARNQVAELQSLKNDQSATSRAQLDSLTQQIDELEKAISRASAGFGNSFSAASVSFDEVRSQLQQGECAIEIVRIDLEGDVLYVALFVEQSSAAPELIVIGKKEPMETKTFTLYKNIIRFSTTNSQIYDVYWRPLEERISSSNISRIYFTPDGIYHRISLGTLYEETDQSYLLDKYDFIQLTSTKDLIKLRSQSAALRANEKVLLIGRPNYKFGGNPEESTVQLTRSFSMSRITDLPGTEEEVNEIDEVLQDRGVQVVKYLGDEAAEGNFKTNLDHEIIHIATHGFFLDQAAAHREQYLDPMLYSGLLLAGASNKDARARTGEDGILTAYEIMNLGFHDLDMVVLSACETGTGEISSGEGVYGLQRAFFVAGANTLIMSLWKVDDQATRDLMTNFYRALSKSDNKREAFIDAQKKVKKKYKSPVYWGAFVMIGG